MGKFQKIFPMIAIALACVVNADTSEYTVADLPQLAQENQHSAAAKRVVSLFTRSHYKPIELDDQLSRAIFDRFVDSLDYRRSILLQSDVDKFSQYRDKFDDALMKGKLDFAYELYNLNAKRLIERYQFALALLDTPMDFTVKDEIEVDRSKGAFPKDKAELDEIWRRRVKFDALSLKMSGKEWPAIKEILGKRYHNAEKRLTQTQSEDVFQIVMNSFARSIEAHTSYLSPRSADRFQMEMNLSLEGIGASLLSEDDYTVISSLVSGGPADKSEKLKPKDKIIGVAQGDDEFVDVIGWRLDDVVELIKGPKGTKVRLQYLSGSDSHGAPKVLELIRDKIRLEDRAVKSELVQAKGHKLDSKIGVVDIPSFYHNLSEDVKAEIAKLKEQNVDGIIIDLRGNGGGSLTEATLLSGLFIERGPVVQIRDLTGKIASNSDNDGDVFYDGPLVVMVDRYSASASEIFAAAMQDYGRAIIVGEQTFGKGTVQQHHPLGRVFDLYENPLGSVQYTIAKFYRINGGSTQHKGVIPDILFPSPIDPAEWGESQEDNALPWDQIKRDKYSVVSNLSSVIERLGESHQKRIAKDPEFAYVFEDIAEYKRIKDRKTISLVEADRVKERKENDAKQLHRANERLTRLKLPQISKLDDAPEVLEKFDPFLEEAALITQDYIQSGRMARRF